MKETVEEIGLTWEGKAHSGLDDTRNLGNIVQYMIAKGILFNDEMLSEISDS